MPRRTPSQYVKTSLPEFLLKDALPVPKEEYRRKYGRDELKGDAQRLAARITTWLLQGNRLETYMAHSSFKDVMIALGVVTDKLLLLEGQPTQIISQQQQQKMDEILPALMKEMQRRGLTADLTERKVSLVLPPEGQA